MAKWASDKILGSSFITHSTSNGYEIHFATPGREKYLAVQEECRRQIDHAKPLTNADRIRAMTNEELAKNLSEFFGECAFVHIPHREGTMPPCSFYDFDCQKCWLEWLKQEVSND